MEHNREDTVKKLIESAKARGSVTVNEILDALNEFDMSPNQMEDVYEQLATGGVEIIQTEVVMEAITDPDDSDIPPVMEPLEIDLSVPDGIAIDEAIREGQECPTAAQPGNSPESGPGVPDLSAMPESQAAAYAAVILDELDGSAGGSLGDDAKAAVREKVLASVDGLFVRHARSLRQQRPEVFERVLRGDLSVPDALRLAEGAPRRKSRR